MNLNCSSLVCYFKLFFLLLATAISGGTPLTINIVCYRNGVGQDSDIVIMSEELKKLGHHVSIIDIAEQLHPPLRADINVFLETAEEYFLPFAERNFFIPNPEWCYASANQIADFDLILCKTKEAERIFKPMNPNTVYLSFTSKDRYDGTVLKNYHQALHLAGASRQKSTWFLIKVWVDNPHFPLLNLIRHRSYFPFPETANIREISDYLSDKDLTNYLNGCGLHICPSGTEGFGHYIMEGLSCGSVVITTDAPPMNEYVADKRCLVKYTGTKSWLFATFYYVDPAHLESVISNVISLPDNELREIGKKNREYYLKNREFFRARLAEIFDSDYVNKLKKATWESTKYVWNFGFAAHCDIGLNPNPVRFFKTCDENQLSKKAFDNLKDGDIAWIRCVEIPTFYTQILPTLTKPIVLVIVDGDYSFPSGIAKEVDIEALLKSEKILHVFAQNCDYAGPSTKVSPLPIGIDFHTIGYRFPYYWGECGLPREQEAVLEGILKESKPTYLRKPRAYVDFQLSDTIRSGYCKRYLELGEDRTTIFNKLKITNLIDYGDRMKRSDLWRTKAQYAFSISPHGNGLDCHRTWEDLALGCIVIVKTSPLDPLYEGLPVVIVKDWSEVNEANLKLWLERYNDASTNPAYRERLTSEYWLKKIRAKTVRKGSQ